MGYSIGFLIINTLHFCDIMAVVGGVGLLQAQRDRRSSLDPVWI